MAFIPDKKKYFSMKNEINLLFLYIPLITNGLALEKGNNKQ